MSLELSAMRWLWLEQKCLVVLEQRTPVYGMGQPDVIGVTPGRYLTEVEIKRSLADFNNDAKKVHRINRARWISLQVHPRQFYYLVPEKLADKVSQKLPEWAGLMTSDGVNATVIVRAPVNIESHKLGVKQCARLSRQMTAHMMGYAIAVRSIKETYSNTCNFEFTDWVDCSVGTWMI